MNFDDLVALAGCALAAVFFISLALLPLAALIWIISQW
jgi:hypothetical protein